MHLGGVANLVVATSGCYDDRVKTRAKDEPRFRDFWDEEGDGTPTLVLIFRDVRDRRIAGRVTDCREINPDLAQTLVQYKNGDTEAVQVRFDAPARTITVRTCIWCNDPFRPKHHAQQHCSPEHETLSDQKRTLSDALLGRTFAIVSRQGCARPRKRTYGSRERALRALREPGLRKAVKESGEIVPYPCHAGHWHLGHPMRSAPRWMRGSSPVTLSDLEGLLRAHEDLRYDPVVHRCALEREVDQYNAEAAALVEPAGSEPREMVGAGGGV